MQTAGAWRPRTLVVAVGLAACVVAVVTVVFSRGAQPGPDGSASCPAGLDFRGARYAPPGELTRSPVAGEPIGEGHFPSCDDGHGVDPSGPLEVRRLPGVSPDVAVLMGDRVWVREGAAAPPVAETATRPVACDLVKPATVTAFWTAVEGARPARFDGDLRLPFTAVLQTSEAPVNGPGWTWTSVSARADAGLDVPTPAEVVAAVLQGRPVTATLRCRASGGFLLTDLALAHG
jgi:hypothetical protein